jgi:hypothetical protein
MNLMRQLASIIPGKRAAADLSFDFQIGWATTYDNLFRSEWQTESEEVEILNRAFHKGRVLLCGRGGSGKTTILSRLHQRQLKSGSPSAFVRVSALTLSAMQDLQSALSEPAVALPFLLRHSDRRNTPADYRNTPERFILSLAAEKLLIVDGLNEALAPLAEKLVQACNSIAAIYPGISVIASDRLVRRSLDENRWALGFVKPLDASDVERALRRSTVASEPQISELARNPVLRLPFFLNKALEQPASVTRERFIETYLKLHGGVEAANLSVLRGAAFRLYEENKARSFPLDSLRRHIGDDMTNNLLAAGTVEARDQFAQFNHHLVHDYLAADYVAEHETLWNAETLDILSFKGASFDATAAVLEALGSAASGKFLRTIYDWNLYAAGYALAEVAGQQFGNVSPDMQEVVYAMLGEKRFDLFAPTARKAQDALLLIRSSRAESYAHAQSLQEIHTLVFQHHTKSADFEAWCALFTRKSSTHATDQEIRFLSDADSVMGWTSANVLKRLSVSTDQQTRIREILAKANSGVARWRAAHVLGSFPSLANRDALESRLVDTRENLWVRYGALRSMMEEAVHGDSEFRRAIFDCVRSRMPEIQAEARLIDELLNSLQVRKEPRPTEWSALAAIILQDMVSKVETEADMERLRQVMSAVEA